MISKLIIRGILLITITAAMAWTQQVPFQLLVVQSGNATTVQNGDPAGIFSTHWTDSVSAGQQQRTLG